MLVLTRCVNESIVLPGLGVTFRVLSVKGAKVRIGIVAPLEVVIVRDELLPVVPIVRPPPPAHV
jgi:carbon storage regulator CsrA